jgi:uncharacterized membrane protein
MIFIYFIKKVFNWLFLLFSDSQFASTRRVIGVTAFAINTIILFIAIVVPILNIPLVTQITNDNFIIILTIVVGANITDVFKFAYRIPSIDKEIDNNQEVNINS